MFIIWKKKEKENHHHNNLRVSTGAMSALSFNQMAFDHQSI